MNINPGKCFRPQSDQPQWISACNRNFNALYWLEGSENRDLKTYGFTLLIFTDKERIVVADEAVLSNILTTPLFYILKKL